LQKQTLIGLSQIDGKKYRGALKGGLTANNDLLKKTNGRKV